MARKNNVNAIAVNGKRKITWKLIKRQRELILLSIPFVAYVLLFNYVPLLGWIMAFQKYKPQLGIFGSQFIGLQKFKELLQRQRNKR